MQGQAPARAGFRPGGAKVRCIFCEHDNQTASRRAGPRASSPDRRPDSPQLSCPEPLFSTARLQANPHIVHVSSLHAGSCLC